LSTLQPLPSSCNFVVETWACARKENDGGLHTVLASGNGGVGLLICQQDDKWGIFVGGDGLHPLDKMQPET
jgi:hypothetical protein